MKADQGFDFPTGFPPDPGEEGKRTIEGIDSDRDGVRDDVQRWIYARFPKDPKRQAALRQLAKSDQEDLNPSLRQEQITLRDKESQRAVICLHQAFTEDSLDYPIIAFEIEIMHAKVVNTRLRTEAFIRNDQLGGARVIKSLGSEAEKSACD